MVAVLCYGQQDDAAAAAAADDDDDDDDVIIHLKILPNKRGLDPTRNNPWRLWWII